MAHQKFSRKLWALVLALGLGGTLGIGIGGPAVGAPPGWSQGVESWITDFSGSQRLAEQPRLAWRSGAGPAGSTIVVDPRRRYQTMTGFGASMTDSSAYVLTKNLSARTRAKVMEELFSPERGIGLSMLRQPMGASDFAVKKAYSYDDQPKGKTDNDLSDFSIKHDRAYILPRLREAYGLNPDLSFMATPWSAPGWMKDSKSMIKGSLKKKFYDAYARYFVKFIKAYRAAGIPTDFVSMGNEPLYEPENYPGMGTSAKQAAAFVGDHLGPELAKRGLSRTKILAYDHNWDVTDYPETSYRDRQAARYTTGTAWHCYGGDVVAQTVSHNNYPHAPAWETECSGGTWQGSASAAFELTMGLMIGVPRNWGQSVVLWNLALDEKNGPFIGGCDVCRGVVTAKTDGTVSKELEYYALGHTSKFVRPGAVRLGSSSLGSSDAELSRSGVSNVAYANPDGSQVLVAFNAGTTSKSFAIQVGNRYVDATLAPGAAGTYRWSAPKRAGGGDLGYVDLDFGRGPHGTPTGRLTQTVNADVVAALTQVRLGDQWLGYSLPYGAKLKRSGSATTLDRSDWELSATGTQPVKDDPLSNMIDGDIKTRWSSGAGQADTGMSLTVDLGSSQTFSEISLDNGTSAGDFLRKYAVQTSDDKTTWTDIARGVGRDGETVIALPPTTTRYLRLVSKGTAGNWWSIHELNLRNVTQNASSVKPGRSLVRDQAELGGTSVIGWYNDGRRAAKVPWPVAGFGYTYRLPATAAVTFTVRAAPTAG